MRHKNTDLVSEHQNSHNFQGISIFKIFQGRVTPPPKILYLLQ